MAAELDARKGAGRARRTSRRAEIARMLLLGESMAGMTDPPVRVPEAALE